MARHGPCFFLAMFGDPTQPFTILLIVGEISNGEESQSGDIDVISS